MLLQNIIKSAIQRAGIESSVHEVRPLGEGENNDSYFLALDNGQRLVLRINKGMGGDDLLSDEASALKVLNVPGVPNLVYYDNSVIDGRKWILETYVSGEPVENRLSLDQLRSAGKMLAGIHSHKNHKTGIDLEFLFSEFTKSFGSIDYLKQHPDQRLRSAILAFFDNVKINSSLVASVGQSLIHGDATMSNFLTHDDQVALIDWEFSRFSDPMQDFSTMFYEDIIYNKGKWRIKITPEEKQALKQAYIEEGGDWDESRLQLWIMIDKICASVFLYWRINTCEWPTDQDRMNQYKLDYETICNSLHKNLATSA